MQRDPDHPAMARMAAARAPVSYPLDRVAVVISHGTGGYDKGCRCEECRAGVRDAKRRYRAKAALR